MKYYSNSVKRYIKVLLLSQILLSSFIGGKMMYAAPTAGEQVAEIQKKLELAAKPSVEQTTLSNGDTMVIIGVPGSNASLPKSGIIKPSGGGASISFTQAGGVTTYTKADGASATCSSGTCTGDNSLISSVSDAQKALSTETVKVMVSEKIPGATCWCNIGGVRQGSAGESCGSDIPVDQRRYECTVGSGLSGFQEMFREITRWVVYITMLLGVFAIAGVGIMMAYTGSSDEGGAKAAKKWAINIVVGLIILFTFRYILGFIAPWIFG